MVGTETGKPSVARLSKGTSCSDYLFTKSEQSEPFQPFGPRPALIGAEHSPPGFSGLAAPLVLPHPAAALYVNHP